MYTREVDDPVMIQYIILFTLSKAERRVTHTQLTSLTLDRCNISFASFQIALDNLVGIEYIKVLPNGFDENMPIYDLTEKGIEANKFFSHSIPVYIRDQIAEYVKPFFEQESLKKSIKAELVETRKDEYAVNCAVYDSASPLLEVNLFAGDRKTAAQMIRNFKKNPDKVYTEIMTLMLGDSED